MTYKLLHYVSVQAWDVWSHSKVYFGASLVFTHLSISKTNTHAHINMCKVFQGYCRGIFCKLISRAVVCVWEGKSGVNLRPAVATSIPSWSIQGSSRSLQTNSVTLNKSFSISNDTKLTLNSQQPVKAEVHMCNLFDRVWLLAICYQHCWVW